MNFPRAKREEAQENETNLGNLKKTKNIYISKLTGKCSG